MTEICFYFKLIENSDFIKCNLCNDKIDLNKSFAILETHMKAKHKEKQWDQERFIIGNSGVKLMTRKTKPQKGVCDMCGNWKNLTNCYCVYCNAQLTPESMTKFTKSVEKMYNKLASTHPIKKYYGDKPFNKLLKRNQKKIIKRQREVKLGHYTDEALK